ncbi:MAG: hypothetical protein ACLQU4_01245 [Limisphaerales bacterium]
MRSLTNKLKVSCGGLMSACCLALVGCVAVMLTAGCQKHTADNSATVRSTEGIAQTDPQVLTNLTVLTHELRHCMDRHALTGDFQQFVDACQVTVPPPPAGEKYAITKSWRVILIADKAK